MPSHRSQERGHVDGDPGFSSGEFVQTSSVEASAEAPASREESGADYVESVIHGLQRATLMIKKPRVPENFNNLLTKPRLKALKQYIGSFQYRLNLQTNFNAHKLRPLARIMDTARMLSLYFQLQIVFTPQPIKCVEAVFVALYLTASLPDVDRVPLGFKTELHGQVYQHIVLLVKHGGKWGAFGISRCPDLMNKDLIFDSMSGVIENFKLAYESQGHIVLKVRVGLPVEHSLVSPNFVCWRHLNIRLKYTLWSACVDEIDKHAAMGKRLWDMRILSGIGEDLHKTIVTRKVPLNMEAFSPSKKIKMFIGQDATLRKAKSVAIEHSITCKALSSSDSCTIVELNSNLAEIGDAAKETKFVRAAKKLPISSAGIIMPVVRRRFLLKNCIKGTLGNSEKPSSRPSILSSSRPRMVEVGAKPFFARIAVHMSYQTRNAEMLLPQAPRRSIIGQRCRVQSILH